jgi:hypothetical protein
MYVWIYSYVTILRELLIDLSLIPLIDWLGCGSLGCATQSVFVWGCMLWEAFVPSGGCSNTITLLPNWRVFSHFANLRNYKPNQRPCLVRGQRVPLMCRWGLILDQTEVKPMAKRLPRWNVGVIVFAKGDEQHVGENGENVIYRYLSLLSPLSTRHDDRPLNPNWRLYGKCL